MNLTNHPRAEYSVLKMAREVGVAYHTLFHRLQDMGYDLEFADPNNKRRGITAECYAELLEEARRYAQKRAEGRKRVLTTPGYSVEEIARAAGVPSMTANYRLKKAKGTKYVREPGDGFRPAIEPWEFDWAVRVARTSLKKSALTCYKTVKELGIPAYDKRPVAYDRR